MIMHAKLFRGKCTTISDLLGYASKKRKMDPVYRGQMCVKARLVKC